MSSRQYPDRHVGAAGGAQGQAGHLPTIQDGDQAVQGVGGAVQADQAMHLGFLILRLQL